MDSSKFHASRTPCEPDPQMWFLKLSTFEGAYGASHHYGRLFGPRGRFQLLRQLDEGGCEKLFRQDTRFGRDWAPRLEPGDDTIRFDFPSEVRDAAVSAFLFLLGEHAPESILLEGNPLSREPLMPLVAPRGMKQLLTAMYKTCVDIDWWDGPECGTIEVLGHKVNYGRDEAMRALSDHFQHIRTRFPQFDESQHHDVVMRFDPIGGWVVEDVRLEEE